MTASSIVVPWKKIARTTALTAAIVTTALLAGCGGGGGGSRAVITPTPTGSNITPTNVVQKATDALGMLDFFPAVTQILNIVTGAVPALVASVPSSLSGEICLGGSGTAELTWGDVDSSGTMNVGDTITLSFAACQFDAAAESTTGSVTLTLTSNILLPLGTPLALTFDADVAVDTTDAVGVESLDATFQVTIESANLTDITVTYGTGAGTDLLTVASGGTVTGQLGCFSVEHTISLLGVLGDLLADTATLVPQAITMNAAGEVVVVDGTGAGTLALSLDANADGPVAGVVNLLSEIPVGMLPCPSLGIDASGVASDGSYATLTADADGVDATLQVFDAADAAVGSPVTIDWVNVF